MGTNDSFIVKTTKKILIMSLALFMGVLAPAFTLLAPHKASALSPTTYYKVPFGFATNFVAPVTGSDGNLWFAEQVTTRSGYGTTESIARMTPSGTFTSFTLPFGWDFSTYGVDVEGMATGPDGAIWFTDTNTNQIERLTTAGQFTNHYYLPSPYAYGDVGSLASGPDGNLWFTMQRSNKIGRITTSGSITLYQLPTGSYPVGITTGTDGNMWFIESQARKIGKISTAGAITEYPVPNGEYAGNIVAGPDGNMWFTELLASKIAKISTAGVITEYSAPASNSVTALTAGSDGALWFYSFTNDNPAPNFYGKTLVRMTTTGATSVYPVFGAPTDQPDNIYGLSSGPNGVLWSTDRGNNQIIRIDTLSLLTPAAPANLTAASPTRYPVLTWDVVSTATAYKVFRDGSAIATTTTPSYTDSTATEGVHSYYVKALNGDIASDASNTVTVTVDRTRPTMSFVEPTSFADPFATGPTVTVTASDPSGLSIIAIHVYTSANQLLTTCGSATPTELAAGTMSCSLANLPDGTYYIKAGTFDNANNNKTILSGNFTIQHN